MAGNSAKGAQPDQSKPNPSASLPMPAQFRTRPCGSEDGDPVSWTLEVRRSVAEFALDMEATLRKNDYKGGWRGGFTTGEAMKRLYQEARELSAARERGEPTEAIIREACDVANFAMMVWDRTRRGLP